ncbi:hypothetical protein ACF1BQ_036130 [Bradyrhizobium sp. RDT10]
MNERRSITIRWRVPLRDALLKSGSPSIAVIGVQRSERREGPRPDLSQTARRFAILANAAALDKPRSWLAAKIAGAFSLPAVGVWS